LLEKGNREPNSFILKDTCTAHEELLQKRGVEGHLYHIGKQLDELEADKAPAALFRSMRRVSRSLAIINKAGCSGSIFLV
jgi:hypothetical protein